MIKKIKTLSEMEYPISSSGEESPSVLRMFSVSFVGGPRPSCALITAVNACAAIPYPLHKVHI